MLKHTVSIMDPYVSKLDLKRVKYCFLANYIMPREKIFFFLLVTYTQLLLFMQKNLKLIL